jgi:hypothetical protein
MNSRRSQLRRHKTGIVALAKRERADPQTKSLLHTICSGTLGHHTLLKPKRLRALPRHSLFCYLRDARICSRRSEHQMKSLILAIAAAIALSSFAMVTGHCAGRDSQASAATIVQNAPQQTGAAMKLAMGPTSAAHLPGGPVNQSSGANSKCSPPSDPCPNLHKNAKYRHKPSSQN